MKKNKWNKKASIIGLIYYVILFVEDCLQIHIFSSSLYLRAAYFYSIGHKLHLRRPEAFTEKLQWMKLYDRNPMYSILSDKYLAKDMVKESIGKQYIVPTIGLWNSAEDVSLDELPDHVVLKCTHDCGSVIVFNKQTDKWDNVRKHLSKSLKKNYYYISREWSYKNIKPKIIAEPVLKASDQQLLDYKFFCFNGRVEFFKIDFDRYTNHRANYYSRDGIYLNWGEEAYPRDPSRTVEMPHELSQMIQLAEKISENFYFLRVDMYNVNGDIKIGELTVYPGSGLLRYDPEESDYKIGKYLNLPEKRKNSSLYR